jgi:hypothetical protein
MYGHGLIYLYLYRDQYNVLAYENGGGKRKEGFVPLGGVVSTDPD